MLEEKKVGRDLRGFFPSRLALFPREHSFTRLEIPFGAPFLDMTQRDLLLNPRGNCLCLDAHALPPR